MAIIKPENMSASFADKKFNMIIYGAPGVGKTTLALSAPSPVIVDCDRGLARVRADHLAPAIMPDKYEDILADLQSPEMRDFETVVIDTGGSLITMLQDWAIRQNRAVNAQKNGALSLKGFGAVKAEFLRFSEWLRVTLKKHVIIVFHSQEQDKNGVITQRLLCDGAAKNLVWTPADFGCFVAFVGNTRTGFFAPEEEFFAKRCFGIQARYAIPDVPIGEKNDFLTRLFDEAKANINADAEAFAGAKRKYEAAIETGRDIVSGINDPETAKAAEESIKKIDHALTSLPEVRAMFARRLAEIGVKWDKARQEYVSAQNPATAA